MKSTDNTRNHFCLVDEMFATSGIVKNFDRTLLDNFLLKIRGWNRWMITGEGSSRIFPGKNLQWHKLLAGRGPEISVHDSTQLRNINLSDYLVFGASNSGKTKELIDLFSELKSQIPGQLLALSSHHNTPLAELATSIIYTDFCSEKAIGATQSVVIQALIYDLLLIHILGHELDLNLLSSVIEVALSIEIPCEVVQTIVNTKRLFVVGADNGVAEEIALKAIETIRKPTFFISGTMMLHGFEEIVESDDVFLLFDPLGEHIERIIDIYCSGIGAKVIMLGTKHPNCLTVPIPSPVDPFFEGYQKLAIGWNLLATIGIEMGVDIDKPTRARKIGNSY